MTSTFDRCVRVVLLAVLLHLCCVGSSATEEPSSTATNLTERKHPPGSNSSANDGPFSELPKPILRFPNPSTPIPDETEVSPRKHKTRRKGGGGNGGGNGHRSKPKKRKTAMQTALHSAARKGLAAMIELYDRQEPDMLKRGAVLAADDPGALLAQFSASNQTEMDAKAAYAALVAAKKFKESTNVEYVAIGRQAPPKISLKRTPLEKLCPSRETPRCVPASLRYRTHDGTCNNGQRPRWGSSQMPFHRFLAPEYQDGVEGIRRSVTGANLPSARFVSLVVHGSRNEEAPVTMMLALWGQLIDHDVTATAQPRSLNGSTPRCCSGGEESSHPSCLPIKVPQDDPWLSHLGVRCLEFLRSAPAQRRDCLLSWREQTNQATSFLDASSIYSSNPRTSDNARIFRSGLLLFGRGPPHEDVCFRAALANQCIRPGDSRSGEQPGLLMMHMIWVNEHNQIATRLADLNPHWSDEKVYQEGRRIVGALFQHITYREFLPLVLGREVCRLFGLELETSGYYRGYDAAVNPTIANEFSAAAFRFGHSLIQNTYMRADRNHRFIANNVSLHEDTAEGDFGGPGSLHRLLRGMVNQRALKRDEFITAELTNHLFQTKSFPFGLDLAAINIQRGRDHGLPAYVNWRGPCGLSTVKDWLDLDRIMGPASMNRLRKAYRTVDDIDLFVGGLAERPVLGGIVGPTFSCIIAQQFSNLRKGDRFWYENGGFESSFTPAQLESIRQVAFSQVLCRALGGGGTLQPFVFLPPDFGQNERLPCESRLMAPIDLNPWLERDPFNNDKGDDEDDDSDEDEQTDEEHATDTGNDLDSAQSTTSTTRRPATLLGPSSNVINKVDLVTNGNTGLQSRPQLTVGPTVIISDKLDLKPTTSTATTTGAQVSTAIDHKLDLRPTTKPTSKRKPTRKPTTKRRPTHTASLVSNNLDFSGTRANTNGTTRPDGQGAKKKKGSRTRRTVDEEEGRGNGYYQTPEPSTDYSDYDDDYYDAQPPYLAYGYHRPTTTTTTTTTTSYYPYYYYNTEPPTPPNPYFDTRRPQPLRTTTPRRRVPDKLTQVDRDPQRPRTTTARTPTQRPSHKPPPAHHPSHTSVFSVDFKSLSHDAGRSLVALGDPSNIRPMNESANALFTGSNGSSTISSTSVSTRSSTSSVVSSSSSASFVGGSSPSVTRTFLPTGDLPMKLSESFSTYDYDNADYDETRPDRLTQRPNTHATDGTDFGQLEDHDGYLRPEQTHFEPLVRDRDVTGAHTYRDYWTPDRTKTRTYADQLDPNARPLHADDGPNTDVYRRYAPGHDGQLLVDEYSDKFVGLLLDVDGRDGTAGDQRETKRKRNRPEPRSIRDGTDRDRTTLTKLKDKRPNNHHRPKVPVPKKPAAISLVPFVLLTSIDRPDNWVMYNSKPSKRRKPPRAVPLLKSDTFSLSEFPSPIADPD
ncbi:uncharacterized protein LOC131284054 [Anopheles ziemanni]|uniref:uncharacterized protein LOC131260767 n=1 Tax=Anopheles coustani TaxID=139045 RepID=UPI002658945F|nr:uncharacterized protein LOC131260767 [Anopheles coustani]XP_058168891.1 uncharacterized protein LOC131284054 [Anopheles ziemanni]